jgi:DNA-directed RNA polymerase subunit RPC12/RpoP
MSNQAKCLCQHCGEKIAFPIERAGEIVDCPHCKRGTLLVIPPVKPSQIVRCPCQHCRKLIGFEASELAEENSVIPCPHCGQKTKLFIPPPPSPAKLAVAAKEPAKPETKSAVASQVVRCPCQHCRKPIGFEASELTEENSVVPCPHCGQKTKLFVPPPASPTQSADGVIVSKEDTLKLAGDRLIIRRRNWENTLAGGDNGERILPISSLTMIHLKPAGPFTLGYILFSFTDRKRLMGGIQEPSPDSAGFLFDRELNGSVADLKAKVEKLMREPKPAAPAAASKRVV